MSSTANDHPRNGKVSTATDQMRDYVMQYFPRYGEGEDEGKRAARTGRNPKTGETIKIPAAKTVKFTAGKAFKDAVNKR